MQKLRLLAIVVCLLLGWTTSGEKLSAEQKAPQYANSSAGRSLPLPRADDDDDEVEVNEGQSSSNLAKFLAGLRIKTSGQTPADTSLLKSSRRANNKNALELLHIKAFGQTPADTSLLPARRVEQNPAASSGKQSISHQRPRVGQGPAHVTLINAEKSSGSSSSSVSAGQQTPANVALLRPGAGGTPSAAAPSTRHEEGVQREEMTSFKDVNGESVRVVVGNYGYASPEGLPVSFKYMSDENGNQASFSIGIPGAAAGGGSGGSRPSSGAGTAGNAKGSASTGGNKGGAGGGAAGKTAGDGDRKYLPPK